MLSSVALLAAGVALAGGVTRGLIESAPMDEPARLAPADLLDDSRSPSPPVTTRHPSGPPATATRPLPPSDQQESARIPSSGPGDFDIAGGEPSARPFDLAYTVEIERGLPFSPGSTAAIVDATLNDDRGWTAARGTTFRRVGAGADIRILVATPSTTDSLCAPLATRGRVSCRNGELIVLNARRWAFGVPHYRKLLADYRRYLVNHEVGHVLGEAHASCPGPGQPAPVMLQQTYGLDGCSRNPWPTIA